MYITVVLLLMLVLPSASVALELKASMTASEIVFLIGKWFVFWSVGVRLFTAGLRQAIRPQLTARDIFKVNSPESLIIVQELGFSNMAVGLLGLITLFQPTWVLPAAFVGCAFYGFAGFRHIAQPGRNRLENIALVSDLFIFAVLLGCLLWTFIHR